MFITPPPVDEKVKTSKKTLTFGELQNQQLNRIKDLTIQIDELERERSAIARQLDGLEG